MLDFTSSFHVVSLNTFLISGAITSCLYLCYRWALPRPIPGIPYNEEATKSLFGDMRPMIEHLGKTQELFDWVESHLHRHQSPIVQVFARPFVQPWVIVADFRETQDIMLRRTKEFDRSDMIGDLIEGVVPENHFPMKTNDKFKQHRRWLQDLMTPAFLNEVTGPQIYSAFTNLIDLWVKKERLAEGHPFEASTDIYHTALDAAWAAAFGADSFKDITRAQLETCSAIQSLELPSDIDQKANLPIAPIPANMQAVLTLSASFEVSLKSPFPRFAHWVLRQTPAMKNAMSIKDRFIREEVEKTNKRFEGKAESGNVVRCAMDDMLRRELLLAEKENREPLIRSRGMRDEIFGFVEAGHETTATTMSWTLKFLADNPSVQSKLRSELRACHMAALQEKRNPLLQEITKNSIPYLDAVVEESIRCAKTAPAIARTAMVDTDVLGHHIPKGTNIIFMGNGPSHFSPSFPIPDSLRSPSSRAAKDRIGSWDPANMSEFNSERWLVEENGEKVFNAAAGPLFSFGLGPRGCFGRRMAYLEMRAVMTLIVWNFELQKCPKELSGYGAVDKLTRQPSQCYVRLAKVQ